VTEVKLGKITYRASAIIKSVDVTDLIIQNDDGGIGYDFAEVQARVFQGANISRLYVQPYQDELEGE